MPKHFNQYYLCLKPDPIETKEIIQAGQVLEMLNNYSKGFHQAFTLSLITAKGLKGRKKSH